MEDQKPTGSYARRVGERLRAIRKQKGLSLQDVEASSHQEFKASVLGAYERGERSISVPRLQRLARFYSVPVDQLLPHPVDIDLTTEEEVEPPEGSFASRRSLEDVPVRVTLDLTRFDHLSEPESEMLRRYVAMIQVQRQDFNGRVMSIRRDDLRTIAGLLGTDTDAMVRRLDDLGLRVSA